MRLQYWFRLTLGNIGSILGGSALYSLLMFVQSDNLRGYTLPQLPMFFLLFGAFLSLGLSLGVYRLPVSLALSFGSTRREVLAGLQLYRLLPALVLSLCAAALNALAGENAIFPASVMLPLGMGMFLSFGAIGSMLSAVLTRFGTAAAIITGVFIVVIGLAGGIVIVIMSFSRSSILPGGFSLWLLLGLGVALHALSCIPERRLVRGYTVKL